MLKFLSAFLLSQFLWTTASAQIGAVIGAVGGQAIVGKAGEEFRQSIDHAHAAASALLDKANNLGRERLNQVDKILDETVRSLIDKSEDSAIKILDEATKKVALIRKDIFEDLRGVIWDVECAGKRLTLQDLPQALGWLGDVLDTNQIALTPLIDIPNRSAWDTFFNGRKHTIDIVEPFDRTYVAVRDLMERSIASDNVFDETPAHHIVGTYEYISSFALKTTCFYPGSGMAWDQAYVEYRDKAKQWRDLMDIKVN